MPTYLWISSLIAHRAFRLIPATALRVLLVLVRHRNPRTGLAYPSHRKIAEILGVKRQTVTRESRWLIDHGVVTAERRWYRSATRLVYRLPFIDDQGSAGASTVIDDQGSAGASTVIETKAALALHQGSAGASTVAAQALPPSEEVGVEVGAEGGAAAEPAAVPAASAATCNKKLLEALLRTGIGEPTLSKGPRRSGKSPLTVIAAEGGLSAEDIDRLSDTRRETGRSLGCLVLDIEAASAAKLAKVRHRRVRVAERVLRAAKPEERDAIRRRYSRLPGGLIAAVPDRILLARPPNDAAVIRYLLNGETMQETEILPTGDRTLQLGALAVDGAKQLVATTTEIAASRAEVQR